MHVKIQLEKWQAHMDEGRYHSQKTVRHEMTPPIGIHVTPIQRHTDQKRLHGSPSIIIDVVLD